MSLEVHPAKICDQTRDTSQLLNYRDKAVRSPEIQTCNFIQSTTYQPRILPWARSAYNLTPSCQSVFRPITKKTDPIIDNDSSDTSIPLGHRSFGDGKCSSPDSFKSRNDEKLTRKVEQQHQMKASTITNYCNNPATNTSDLVKINDIQYHHSPSVAAVELNKDEHFKFGKDLENRNQLHHSTTSFELDQMTTSITSISNDASAITESRFDESSSAISESPPPPYLESEDGAIGPVNDRIHDYDYDLHYYLSSSDEKNSVSSDISAIPFTFTEAVSLNHIPTLVNVLLQNFFR